MLSGARIAGVILLVAAVGYAEVLTVRVVRVVDGDTFHGRVRSGTVPRRVRFLKDSLVPVRLEGIDAPERDQPWGDSSRAALSRMLDGREAAIDVVDVDGFRRIVGRVRTGSVDVNATMVARGHAWMFRRYTSSVLLDSLERSSRSSRRGLWSAPSPVEPWVWRKQQRRQSR